MLKATHTDFAPWTLVDFNDQALGRLTLLRDLLDRVPDTELPLNEIPWPPLAGQAGKERYGVLKPIPQLKPRGDDCGSVAKARNLTRYTAKIRRGNGDEGIESVRSADRLLCASSACYIRRSTAVPRAAHYLPVGGVEQLINQPQKTGANGLAKCDGSHRATSTASATACSG